MDTGGLAQMTSNNFPFNGGLGMPGSGFASRGKGAHIKRLSVQPPTMSSINENGIDPNPTPRTARSHLLAGLRKAPKTSAVPASAPYHQTQHQFGLEASKYADPNAGRYDNVQQPQSAMNPTFPSYNNNNTQYGLDAGRQMYSLPEQVLAPPTMQFDADEHMDPNLLAQMAAAQMYLAQRQQQLQQQLAQLNQIGLASQLQGLSLNTNAGNNRFRQHQAFPSTPITPQVSVNPFGQQLQNAMAPITQELPGQPGVYLVYNPLSNSYQYAMDNDIQQQLQQVQQAQQIQLASSPPPPTPGFSASPPNQTPTFRAQVSPPPSDSERPVRSMQRSISPPKKVPTPPQDVEPLPPPSANAFRRGHKKSSSLAFSTSINTNVAGVSDGPKTAGVRTGGFPQTPLTGTFRPGQGRAGEHPIREPRGPPPLEELIAAPTSKHEGSKNFATRQRRRAVHNLVRAGIERRGVRTGSGGMTPVSENEISFSLSSSDNESEGFQSGTLSGKPSDGSLRASANGVIGSERKNWRSRDYTANSVSSDEGNTVGGKLVEVKVEEPTRKAPLLVLSSAAEKRKSSMF